MISGEGKTAPIAGSSDAARVSEAMALHHRAHELCFVARSVKFPVHCEAEVTGAAGAA